MREALLLATLSPLALGPAATPMPVAAAICTGSTFAGGGIASAAIAGGRLLMWGVDSVGQLGQGRFVGLQPTPGPVTTTSGLTTVNDVFLGQQSSFAVDGSGNAWGWGSNEFFQLGRQTPQFTTSPLRINGPTNVQSIASGAMHTLAVTADGTVWGWGFSVAGELNFASGSPQVTPQAISGISGAAKAAAGGSYSLLLMSDGTVLGGGSNSAGQLGLGFTGSSLFTQVPGLSNIVDISAGQYGGDSFLVAVDVYGHVLFSGSNFHGELGDGTTSLFTPQRTVVQVPNLNGVFAVAAGGDHVLALRLDGTVMAWGSNEFGQLGNGSVGGNNGTPAQVQFPGGAHIVAVAAGTFVSMAIDDQGRLWAWGDNSAGQMAEDPTVHRNEPSPTLITVTAVSAPCASPRRLYIPSRDGYSFVNGLPNGAKFTAPGYDQMKVYYPDSVARMYHSDGTHSKTGDWFYNTLFKPTFEDGLCYGMATSDTFLFNRSSVHPETFSRWQDFSSALNGNTLAPPLVTTDSNIQDFIERFHARQLAALGAASSIAVWTQYGLVDVGTGTNRVRGNLAAFDDIAARVQTSPQVVAFGPSPYIFLGGPAIDPRTNLPTPLPNPGRFTNLYNNSHAVVAYGTDIAPDGTRLIHVYDPSSLVSPAGNLAIDQSDIRIAPDGSLQLVDFANGGDANGNPKAWIGAGIDGQGRDMGQPNDWILMPLPDNAFSENGTGPLGIDNHHWLIPDLAAILYESLNIPISFPPGLPIFRVSGTGAGTLAMQLPEGAGDNEVLTANGAAASTTFAVGGRLVTVTQTDANAAGSSHHLVIDPAATSINLDSASQPETFNLEIAADHLPTYSRDIFIAGVSVTPSQSLNFASDVQTSGLTLSSSSSAPSAISTTFEQDGANAGRTTVLVTVPANGLAGSVVVFDWNTLGTSLIYEVVDAQGSPTGLVLQGNSGQLTNRVSTDLATLQATIAGVADAGLRNSLQAKIASAQNSFSRGQSQAAANAIQALRSQIGAQAGKALDAATVTSLRSVSADALILMNAA